VADGADGLGLPRRTHQHAVAGGEVGAVGAGAAWAASVSAVRSGTDPLRGGAPTAPAPTHRARTRPAQDARCRRSRTVPCPRPALAMSHVGGAALTPGMVMTSSRVGAKGRITDVICSSRAATESSRNGDVAGSWATITPWCSVGPAGQRFAQRRDLLAHPAAGHVGRTSTSRPPAVNAASISSRRDGGHRRGHRAELEPASCSTLSSRWKARVRSSVWDRRSRVSHAGPGWGAGARSWGGPARAPAADRSRPSSGHVGLAPRHVAAGGGR